MASGDTKTEALLNVLGNGGDATAYKGCCNTKTQQYILDAIDRVQGVEDEVEELKNNPDVVDIVDTYQDLQDYDTSTLTDKDIVRVLSDSTHSGNSTYYRWNASTNQFDFVGEIAGGGSVTPVQTTGTSTTDVMSQNATTSMVFNDPSNLNSIQIGNSASSGSNTVAVGRSAYAGSYNGAIALGAWSSCSTVGEMNIGSTNTNAGYNSSNYRLLSGVHDPVNAHDAATKGYVDANAIGTTESYTITTNNWSALSASSPYTYSATVTATYTIGNNTIAELINDNAVTFSNYGFAIGSISGQNVTIYSIGQPDASVTLKVNYKG